MKKEGLYTQDYIREFVTIIFIQRRIIFIVSMFVLLIVLFVAFLWPPIYSSEARILVKQKKVVKSPESLERVMFSQPQVTENDINSEMQIITSTDVIEHTIKQLQEEKIIVGKELNTLEFRALVRKIKENLKVEATPKSDVFKVSFYWDSPIAAEKILKILLKKYLEYRLEIFAPSEAEVFFQQQVNTFDKKMADLEKQLINLATEGKNPVPDEKIKSNLLIQQSLEADLNKMMNSYVEKKRFVMYIQETLKSDKVNCFSFIDSINIGDFGKKVQDLLIEREKLRGIYTDNSPPVISINEQIKEASKALRSEVQRYVDGEMAKLKAMEEAIQSMSERLSRLREDNVNLYKNAIKSKALERQLKLAEESFSTFMKRWEEAKIDRSGSASSLFTVSIISDAEANLVPVFPNKRILLPVGFILSVILGVTVGFVVEFFDHRFKRPEDVERYAGLQTLFSIPKF